MSRTQQTLRRVAQDDPELAARLILQALPAAAGQISGELDYDLAVEGIGAYRVSVADGRARVEPLADGSPGSDGADFALLTDARGLAAMAAGASPAWLMLRRQLRIRGKRRRALKLREMGAEASLAEVVQGGGRVDPDLLYRSLPYAIEPEWTRGHRFVVAYELTGNPSGTWYVEVRDGEPVRVTREPPEAPVAATVRTSGDTYLQILARELTPSRAMQRHLTVVDGAVHPVTILGRWIERAEGADGPEQDREDAQRRRQESRLGTWGSAAQTSGNGSAGGGQGDPAHESEGRRRATGELLDYGQLYALWEKQNWKAHELDFSRDRVQWLATPSEAQQNTMWSLGSFYAGEERVTADLAPFLMAAPTTEIEIFLSTQLVDEARHAAFFDRFAAEVMALESDDMRGRLSEIEATMPQAWRDVFDGALRGVAGELRDRPDDLDLFVRGVATYHMVIEGFLAMTGQRMIIDWMADHDLYPGFVEGFSLVERDEHRHIAFGVRFLREMVERDSRYGEIVERTVAELVPKAALVLCPPYVDDPSDFMSYGYHSSHVYGYAYRALKRRLTAIGLELPPPEDLLPGPISEPGARVAATA